MALNYDELDALCAARGYDLDAGYATPAKAVFGLLVDVADYYLFLLEQEASTDPAPFLGGTTPTDAALLGLAENLELKRDGTSPQHRGSRG